MYKLELIPFDFRHIAPLAADMKAPDVLDAQSAGHTPEEALRLACASSDFVWTFVLDGVPVSALGMIAPVLSDTAVVWELGTTRIEKIPVSAVKWGRLLVSQFLTMKPILTNVTDARNTQSLKWLKSIGFELEPLKTDGRDVVRLTARRK